MPGKGASVQAAPSARAAGPGGILRPAAGAAPAGPQRPIPEGSPGASKAALNNAQERRREGGAKSAKSPVSSPTAKPGLPRVWSSGSGPGVTGRVTSGWGRHVPEGHVLNAPPPTPPREGTWVPQCVPDSTPPSLLTRSTIPFAPLSSASFPSRVRFCPRTPPARC